MAAPTRLPIHPGAYPLLRIALCYAAGIVAGRALSARSFLEADTSLFVLTATCVLLCAAIPALPARIPAVQLLRFRVLPLLYLLTIMLFGIFQYGRSQIPTATEELLLQHFDSDELLFSGTVRIDRATRSGNRMMTVDVDTVRVHGLPTWKRGFRTEVLARTDTIRRVAGSRIYFRGDLQPPRGPRNPNQFDYAAFLARSDIHTQIFVSEIIRIDLYGDPGFWLRQQIRIRSAVNRLFSDTNAGLARAVMLGDRSDLPPDLRTNFSRAGLAHLMAVSGMHVGFILMPVWFVLPWFRRSAILRATGLALGGTLLLLYAGVTGFSVSVSRAALMAFLMMLARMFHKPGTSMNILGAAALVLLLADPPILFDVGFQLSFTAVIIILTTLPGTRYMLPPSHRYRMTGALFQFVMVSVLVQGGLYPVLIHYFNEFSVAGPLSNTLAVPLVQFMFLWTFFCLGIALLQPALAAFLNTPGDLILTALTAYVTRIGSHPASWIEGTLPGAWLFGVWFFATALLASLRLPSVRFKMATGLLCCLVMLQSVHLYDQLRTPTLEVVFWDVGQGDAVLLQTAGGYSYLYDTGVWSPGSDSAERTILPELKALGIRRLDGVILSHPHADHIGGIVTLIHHIPIDTIYQSPAVHDTRLYHRYRKRAAARDIPVRLLTAGQSITTDPSTPMLVLAPSEKIQASDPNNQSVVLMVRYGDTGLLLTGDAEKEAEAFLVSQFGDFLQADLLKVGHHASRTSSTAPFLAMVQAPEAVASLAKRNRYRHPHPEATLRLQEAGTLTRFTSLQGAIIYHSDGTRFTHVPW